MSNDAKITRRDLIKGATACGALVSLGGLGVTHLGCSAEGEPAIPREDGPPAGTRVFRVDGCPTHDGERRHAGVDSMLDLLSEHGVKLFRTGAWHPWGGPGGIIHNRDVVLIKVNSQWKCRGATNTDVVRGLIHSILQHPDGFQGEVVIFENGQGQGSFDGRPASWAAYLLWHPEIHRKVCVNAEEESLLTVDHLVNEVFRGEPVSAYLLDPIHTRFIADTDHVTDGYRRVADVSYPCFTTAGGHRVELREGLWNGSGHDQNLRLINLPVLKTHDGTGITGALKHTFGILSMADGHLLARHYTRSGSHCGQMFRRVRPPDLNLLDCIWVSHESLLGYPPEVTRRADTLLAGIDPVALDYHASKHVLLPLGGRWAGRHDPDSSRGLRNHLEGALEAINEGGGIGGQPCRMGDGEIEVIVRHV